LYTDQIQLRSLAVKSYQHGLESSLLYLTNTLQHKQRFFCFLPLWEKQIICKKKTTTTTIKVVGMCSSRKYPYSPYRRDWNFLWGGEFWKTKNLKKCTEASLEFPEEWRGWGEIPSMGEEQINERMNSN